MSGVNCWSSPNPSSSRVVLNLVLSDPIPHKWSFSNMNCRAIYSQTAMQEERKRVTCFGILPPSLHDTPFLFYCPFLQDFRSSLGQQCRFHPGCARTVRLAFPALPLHLLWGQQPCHSHGTKHTGYGYIPEIYVIMRKSWSSRGFAKLRTCGLRTCPPSRPLSCRFRILLPPMHL